jgi:hypothetical protein
MVRKFVYSALGLLAFGPSAFALAYTGDVSADFSAVSYVQDLDPLGDVGLAGNAPPGTISGWDVERAVFNLDLAADQLNVGLEFYGIAGDADGDGGQGTTSLWLAANGGIDLPGLASTESICIAFDFDQDGGWDVVAGNSGYDALHQVCVHTGFSIHPFAFGAPLPAHQGPIVWIGTAAAPDYELTLNNFSALATIVANSTCFDYAVFAGSYQDDGVGEDAMLGTVCITDDGNVEAQMPAGIDLLAAHPNPFNPATTLELNLAATGHAELAVFNLAGQKVATLVDGMLEAGVHQVRFDAASLPSGLYVARLETALGVQATRLILAK